MKLVLQIKHDPAIRKLMDIADNNSQVLKNVERMHAAQQLFVTTSTDDGIQVHLTDEALDLLYHAEGMI